MKEENSKPTLLIADDHPEILDFLSEDLSEHYEILQAENGKQALDIVLEKPVNLIVSDVMMPEIDGYELCKIIKSNVEHSHIPIILLTAKNTLRSKIEGLEVGADAYIEKPFSPEYLQVQIANLLSNRTKIREYFSSSPLANINTMAYTKTDKQFLDELNEIIHKHINDPQLDVEKLGGLMCMSRPTFYRKIKAISNLTPNDLINITRLKRAAELLRQGNYRIYEISELVGYSSQSHFGRNFQKQFGMSPSEYAVTYKV